MKAGFFKNFTPMAALAVMTHVFGVWNLIAMDNQEALGWCLVSALWCLIYFYHRR